LPGLGLLLMRLVTGISLMYRGVIGLEGDPSSLLIELSVLLIGGGFLLLIGLWTPIAGTLVVAVETLKIFLLPADAWIYILLGTLSAALGAARARRLVDRRSPVWVEARRHSRPAEPPSRIVRALAVRYTRQSLSRRSNEPPPVTIESATHPI